MTNNRIVARGWGGVVIHPDCWFFFCFYWSQSWKTVWKADLLYHFLHVVKLDNDKICWLKNKYFFHFCILQNFGWYGIASHESWMTSFRCSYIITTYFKLNSSLLCTMLGDQSDKEQTLIMSKVSTILIHIIDIR